MKFSIYHIAALLLGTLPLSCSAAGEPPPSLLDAGYQQMYNLDFPGAHQSFDRWKAEHPNDPLGPVSNAAAYLFSEFDRLHILESDLFTDDQRFEKRQRVEPDPRVRNAFESELSKADELENQALARTPENPNATLAKIVGYGLRGDYLALIDKRNLAGLHYMKAARELAANLVARDGTVYDAYLAIGVENYLLGVNPAPVRWLLRLGGAQTDKDQGLANLRLTAEKGHLLAPFARLLLAVAALRSKDGMTARKLLAGLSQEFPRNPLYRNELARIPTR